MKNSGHFKMSHGNLAKSMVKTNHKGLQRALMHMSILRMLILS